MHKTMQSTQFTRLIRISTEDGHSSLMWPCRTRFTCICVGCGVVPLGAQEAGSLVETELVDASGGRSEAIPMFRRGFSSGWLHVLYMYKTRCMYGMIDS